MLSQFVFSSKSKVKRFKWKADIHIHTLNLHKITWPKADWTKIMANIQQRKKQRRLYQISWNSLIYSLVQIRFFFFFIILVHSCLSRLLYLFKRNFCFFFKICVQNVFDTICFVYISIWIEFVWSFIQLFFFSFFFFDLLTIFYSWQTVFLLIVYVAHSDR